jgi:hypothetical protein
MASNMPTTRRRMNITPSDAVWLALDQIHDFTGRPKASIVADMLDAISPVMLEQAMLFKKLKDTPEQARDLLMQFGTQGINTISQQMLELPPVRRKPGRPRKHATP